ncbi:MAG: hypothetical protein ACRCTZ_02940 [Sarcina sp.]
MKKVIIGIIIVVAAIGAIGFGYFTTKNVKTTLNKVSTINSTNSNQTNNSGNSNQASNGQVSNNQINSSQSNNNNQSSNSQGNNNQSNQKNSIQKIASNNGAETTSQTSSLNISSNFTNDQIKTLENIINSENISPGAGTISAVINLDYYSVINGQKYYAIYGNTIPETNWYMAGAGPFPDSNGNYSQLQFVGYANQYGNKISQSEFLNGQLSFNPNDTSNLSQQDITNMIKKIGIMYATYSGFLQSAQQFNASELTNYAGNITVNINNTKNINGQTYYEVEYKEGQPFYISLTGNIYVSQEHYLSTIFKAVPPQTNAQVKASMKGI